MERYIAIDHVCAWPNLTKMPDGAMIATIFNQPCHGRWEGDLECWASEDGGRFWRRRGTPAPHEPGTNRMNVAAGLARNGDLVVLASGWSHRPRQGEGAAGHDAPARPLPAWVCRSTDGGRTWTHAETLAPPAGLDHLVPFGDIVPLADGCLGVALYAHLGGAYCYASADDGHTWSIRGIIQASNINETTLLALPGGDLLACGRTEVDEHLDLFRSTDNGRIWRYEQAVSAGLQHPADLLNLADGRVLLTYGDRRVGQQGIEVRVSDDGGRSWGLPLRVAALDPTDFGNLAFVPGDGEHGQPSPGYDLGYPATVPGDDGTLVTAWYCRCVAAHRRYHMGAAVWRLEEAEEEASSAPACDWMVSAVQPKTGGIANAPCRGLNMPLGWTAVRARAGDGFVNAHERMGEADGIVYFARRFHAPRQGTWELRVGHDGGARIFVDGQPVLTAPETRNPARPGRSRVNVALNQGEHEIVIALDTAAGKGWGIYCSWVIPPAQRAARVARLFPEPV